MTLITGIKTVRTFHVLIFKCSAWKVSEYGVFLVRIFLYSDQKKKTPYLDTFHAVFTQFFKEMHTLHEKWSFPLRVSFVNVKKSAVLRWIVNIYYWNLFGKFHVLWSVSIMEQDISLRGKCPNTKFFLVRIFLYLDWI